MKHMMVILTVMSMCVHEVPLKVHPHVKEFVSPSNEECATMPNEDDTPSCPGFEDARNHFCLVSEKVKCSKCSNYYYRHCVVHQKDKSFTCLNCHKTKQLYGICDANVKN